MLIFSTNIVFCLFEAMTSISCETYLPSKFWPNITWYPFSLNNSPKKYSKVKQVYLVHGDLAAQENLRSELLKVGFENVIIPDQLGKVVLK